jgi:hypothetical protein
MVGEMVYGACSAMSLVTSRDKLAPLASVSWPPTWLATAPRALDETTPDPFAERWGPSLDHDEPRIHVRGRISHTV